MREIRLYGSEGGGAVRSPYPYQDVWVPTMAPAVLDARFRGHDDGLDQSTIKIRHHNYETQY